MRIREHKGFGHGLRPGTDQDINCISCRREQAEGAEPVITGEDDRHPAETEEEAAYYRSIQDQERP